MKIRIDFFGLLCYNIMVNFTERVCKEEHMLKKLAKCVREYKLPTILTLIFIVAEVVIEVLIPFITANLINAINASKPPVFKISGILAPALM